MIPDRLSAAVRDALCLAVGGSPSAVVDWRAVIEAARAERLLGIAWSRSGARIRATAPASAVATWRDAALELDQRARSQLDALVTLSELLTTHGVNATVLKGPPFSLRLYGELGARQSVDLDLLVAPEARPACRRALEAGGWTRWFGNAPWDECFSRRQGAGVEYLEVHSRLPGEALAHCGPLSIGAERIAASTGAIDIAAGPAMPVYFAANMAKHGVLPLSAIVDFDALWSSLGASERAVTFRIARGARLLGCLQWAVQRVTLMRAAADGHSWALHDLGVRAGAREFTHVYLRLIGLADNPIDAARVAGAWVWPRSSRGSWRGLGMVWNRRVRKPLNTMAAFRQSYVGR